MRKIRASLIVIFSLALAVLLSGCGSASKKFEKKLKEGSYRDAIVTYYDGVKGNSKEEYICREIFNDYYDENIGKYLSGNRTDNDMFIAIDTMRKVNEELNLKPDFFSEIYALSRKTIAANDSYTVAIKNDGSVVYEGYISDYELDREDTLFWRDIIDISAGEYHTVGLKSDGTVVAVGNNSAGQCDVDNWRDIVAVSAGSCHTVGLKSDGTVVAVGENENGQCDVSYWKDIVAVSAGAYHTLGLKYDGSVVAVGDNYNGECEVSLWKNIVSICAGHEISFGLRNDGTIALAGDNIYHVYKTEIENLTDVTAVSATYCLIALKSDGTVVAFGAYGAEDLVGHWENIVSVACGYEHLVGLKTDGTIVVAGGENNYAAEYWRNILLPGT